MERLSLKVVACKSLFREVSLLAANSKNFIDATYLGQGFHDAPGVLNRRLQEIIDKIDSGEDIFSYKSKYGRDFDAIVLCYGLCSQAVINLSSKKYNLVIPRCDDCIALLLGSQTEYINYFSSHKGTYFFTPSWIENAYVPSPQNEESKLNEYVQKYGEEDARYLTDIKNSTLKNYERFTYISWDRLDFPEYEEYTKNAAKHYSLEYHNKKGSEKFLSDLLSGNWDERFAVIPKNCKAVRDYNKIISWEKI